MELFQETRTEQRLQLSQTQIQSLEILAMDNVSLNDFLQNEYLENPILEHTPVNDMPADFEALPSWIEKHQKPVPRESWTTQQEDTGKKEFIARKQDSLWEYLTSQLHMSRYSKQEWNLIEYLIKCLDDNGFFTMDPELVARLNCVDQETVDSCLNDLRLLEPWGIFAPDLVGCLLRQLEIQGIDDENLKTIIREHLPDIADGKISAISRHLKLSTAQTRKYIALIQKLNPRPLLGFYPDQSAVYIVPDVIFSCKDGEWDITLNERWMGNYGLSDYYMDMMSKTDDQELYGYFKRAAERARFLLNSLEQRRATLLSIASAILEFQSGYFKGQETLKPMTMNQIADKLGIHTSTVSRGIRDKYIQFPKGTLLMKQLFSTGIPKAQQAGHLTPADIKETIRQLILEEDKSAPLSDQTLTTHLNQRNILISRRTVAKYREELGIRKSFQRKDC